MTCERNYTPAVVTELHAIAQIAELRRRLQSEIDERQRQELITDDGKLLNVGIIGGLTIAVRLLDDLAPVIPAE